MKSHISLFIFLQAREQATAAEAGNQRAVRFRTGCTVAAQGTEGPGPVDTEDAGKGDTGAAAGWGLQGTHRPGAAAHAGTCTLRVGGACRIRVAAWNIADPRVLEARQGIQDTAVGGDAAGTAAVHGEVGAEIVAGWGGGVGVDGKSEGQGRRAAGVVDGRRERRWGEPLQRRMDDGEGVGCRLRSWCGLRWFRVACVGRTRRKGAGCGWKLRPLLARLCPDRCRAGPCHGRYCLHDPGRSLGRLEGISRGQEAGFSQTINY